MLWIYTSRLDIENKPWHTGGTGFGLEVYVEQEIPDFQKSRITRST